MFLIEQDLKFGEMSPLRISEDLFLTKSQSIHPGGLKLSEEHIKFDLNISRKYKKYINTKLSFKLKKIKLFFFKISAGQPMIFTKSSAYSEDNSSKDLHNPCDFIYEHFH